MARKFIKMHYKFKAYGHPNILAIHETTLEFTKDAELTLKGDCIVGVKADFEVSKLKEFIKKAKNKKITITIETASKPKIKETIKAEFNPRFNSDKEFVVRKTDFVSERTFAIKANKSAFDLNWHLIDCLKEKKDKISVIIKNK